VAGEIQYDGTTGNLLYGTGGALAAECCCEEITVCGEPCGPGDYLIEWAGTPGFCPNPISEIIPLVANNAAECRWYKAFADTPWALTLVYDTSRATWIMGIGTGLCFYGELAGWAWSCDATNDFTDRDTPARPHCYVTYQG